MARRDTLFEDGLQFDLLVRRESNFRESNFSMSVGKHIQARFNSKSIVHRHLKTHLTNFTFIVSKMIA